MPPTGDPTKSSEWEKFGPGAIVKRDSQSYEQRAQFLIGKKGVADAQSPDAISPVYFFKRKLISGSNFDASGGYTLPGVADIQASASKTKDKEVEVELGNVYKSQPLGLGELNQILAKKAGSIYAGTRTNVRREKSDVVAAVYYTDGITYTFHEKSSTAGSVKVDVTSADISAELKAKGVSDINGSVHVPTKVFLGYEPVTDVKNVIPR
ncbi:hypothetical protein [Luteolibacter ambystomatis]|uniref:hypothetical protein n=1 Tax=Luteolibacter ambystomatis TaxID=2824561 RepID=UPI0036DCD52C